MPLFWGPAEGRAYTAPVPYKNRRGSPDAVEKRRAARRFNELLLGGPRASDGRTERRRRRLLEELAEGVARRGRRALKPVDVLARVDELLGLGETLASIRKACAPPPAVELTPELADGIRQLHEAYGFSLEAYRFVGLDREALRKAGVLEAEPGGPPAVCGPVSVRPSGACRAQVTVAAARSRAGKRRRGAA